ncbi:hypothetical protein BD779DRAFT_653799 [Infundibulicybe gibba]|nr:hypothetical protein BD779DRAFT_653799 [Infundibulicybe gibba]
MNRWGDGVSGSCKSPSSPFKLRLKLATSSFATSPAPHSAPHFFPHSIVPPSPSQQLAPNARTRRRYPGHLPRSASGPSGQPPTACRLTRIRESGLGTASFADHQRFRKLQPKSMDLNAAQQWELRCREMQWTMMEYRPQEHHAFPSFLNPQCNCSSIVNIFISGPND